MSKLKMLLALAALCGFLSAGLVACDVDVDDSAGSVTEFVR